MSARAVRHWISTAQGRVVVALAVAVTALLATGGVPVIRNGARTASPLDSVPSTSLDAAVEWRARPAEWAAREIGAGKTVASAPSTPSAYAGPPGHDPARTRPAGSR